MASVSISPNTALVSSTVTINGASFLNKKTRLLLDGAGATTNIFRPAADGTFKVGINVSSTPKTQTLVIQQQTGSKWSTVSSTSIIVVKDLPPPPDTTAPVAINIGVTGIQQTSATIAWATAERSTGWVDYGLDTSYGNSTTIIPSANVFTIGLGGLLPDTTYHFRVKNADAANNVGTSADGTFTTLAVVPPPDTTAPQISNVVFSNITTTSASVSWTSNEAGVGQLQYGKTTAYGGIQGFNSGTTFTASLTSLDPNTLYHVKINVIDGAGNTGTTGDLIFTTLAIPSGRVSKTINASQSELLTALADKSIDDIIINDGVIKGGFQINKSHAGTESKVRTVKAKNKYGVKIQGPYTEGINFRNAAAYIDFDGFEFTNANVAQGGCIVFGASGDSTSVAAHHLNFTNMKVGPTITGPSAKGSTANATGHALYIGDAVGEGHHHIVADGWVVDAQDKGLSSGFHMYHSGTGRNNGHDIQIKNFTISGVPQGIILWDSTIFNILIGPNVRVNNSSVSAIRHEYGNATLDDFVSTGSANTPPTGARHGTLVIKANCSLH